MLFLDEHQNTTSEMKETKQLRGQGIMKDWGFKPVNRNYGQGATFSKCDFLSTPTTAPPDTHAHPYL